MGNRFTLPAGKDTQPFITPHVQQMQAGNDYIHWPGLGPFEQAVVNGKPNTRIVLNNAERKVEETQLVRMRLIDPVITPPDKKNKNAPVEAPYVMLGTVKVPNVTQTMAAMVFDLQPGDNIQLVDMPNTRIITQSGRELKSNYNSMAVKDGIDRVILLVPGTEIRYAPGKLVPANVALDLEHLDTLDKQYAKPFETPASQKKMEELGVAKGQVKMAKIKLYPQLERAMAETEANIRADLRDRFNDKFAVEEFNKTAAPDKQRPLKFNAQYSDAEILSFSKELYALAEKNKLVKTPLPGNAKLGLLDIFKEKTKPDHEAMIKKLIDEGHLRKDDKGNLFDKAGVQVLRVSLDAPAEQNKAFAAADGVKGQLVNALTNGLSAAKPTLPDLLTGDLKRPDSSLKI